MSATRALERALELTPTVGIRKLQRLMYCGEWVESHALHIFLLHAPDFLGFPNAIDMAAEHRQVVERGLRIKKAGNALMELIGGRSVHPVSPRVGGFSRAPVGRVLRTLRPQLQDALDDALAALRWAAALPAPDYEQPYRFVALDGDAYPLEQGHGIAISGRPSVPVEEWDRHFVERQVPHSNALQSRLPDGSAYLCGPMARLYHHADKLHPTAAEALRRTGLDLPIVNPFRSIVVRCVEVIHALAEAIDLIDDYERPEPPFVDAPPQRGTGAGATEAPRGLLWHRYEIDDTATITDARIVPPTSQNQARIEEDLAGIADQLLALDHEAATRRCEQLIRNYDPCISCATHFLDLRIGHDPSEQG